ncbi:MAG: hypothetical protein L0154_07590 [Chloroflexi bacterium]|nr:hypothetical protein [Chloroflexota bacterium]
MKTNGVCAYCKNSYTGSGMTRHLKACKARQEAIEKQKGSTPIFHLRIQDDYLSQYWMNIEISGKSTLYDLDQFLRDIWLECCGHLSSFAIGDTDYESSLEDDYLLDEPFFEGPFDPNLPPLPPGFDITKILRPPEEVAKILGVPIEQVKELFEMLRTPPPAPPSFFSSPMPMFMGDFGLGDFKRREQRDMSATLESVLKDDMEFGHIYDFGSSTELTLKVQEIRKGKMAKSDINIMARNDAPQYMCVECGRKKAVVICAGCSWPGNITALCENCSKNHDEYSLLPLVNSPRTGVCGYTG